MYMCVYIYIYIYIYGTVRLIDDQNSLKKMATPENKKKKPHVVRASQARKPVSSQLIRGPSCWSGK